MSASRSHRTPISHLPLALAIANLARVPAPHSIRISANLVPFYAALCQSVPIWCQSDVSFSTHVTVTCDQSFVGGVPALLRRAASLSFHRVVRAELEVRRRAVRTFFHFRLLLVAASNYPKVEGHRFCDTKDFISILVFVCERDAVDISIRTQILHRLPNNLVSPQP